MSDNENILDLYDKLLEYDDDDKKERLAFWPKQKGKSKSFCMAPWTTIYAQPDKNVRLCCTADRNIGSLNENSLEEVWNSEEMKKSRLAMLKGEKVDACYRCYEQEESGAGNNMYNNGGFNGLVNAQGPNAQNEPMAANAGIMPFSGF